MKRSARSTLLLLMTALNFTIITCVHIGSERVKKSTDISSLSSLSERSVAGDKLLSGYATGSETCGDGDLRFPRLSIGTKQGTCVGLVASRSDGLVKPRNIVQLPNTPYFLVVDQNSKGGRVYKLDPTAPLQSRLTLLIDKLDTPMGLAIGPNDQLVYVGLLEEIIRFDPRATNPASTVETVVRGFPVRDLHFSETSQIKLSNHPQKQIIFDPEGNLYVNVGAPTDNCINALATAPCTQSSGTKETPPMAALWKFSVKKEEGGVLPALQPGEANAQVGSDRFEVFATGLRNSMALSIHPNFPDGAFLQAENARDLPGQDRPNEELNVIVKGKNYGWPYCYDLHKTNPEYESLVKKGSFKNFCQNASLYEVPFSLMPPHVAPLGATYYVGDRFPELKNTWLVTWHGYIATGSRVVFYKTDSRGYPTLQKKSIQYRKNCEKEQQVHELRSDGESVLQGAQFEELISDWYQVSGVRPQGAPVSITVAEDGAIWLVEDKNATILRIDRDARSQPQKKFSCDGRSEEDIQELYQMIQNNSENKARLNQVRKTLGEKYCSQCHGGFDLKPEMNDLKRDEVFARYLLGQNGWIYPGDLHGSMIYQRVRREGMGATNPMPPNWADIANNPDYKNALEQLDQLILNLVPGERYSIQPTRAPVALVRGGDKVECGRLPTNTIVIVTKLKSSYKGMAEIFKPDAKYLSQPCKKGFYVPDWAIKKLNPGQ